MDKNAFLIQLSERMEADFRKQNEVQRVFSAIWRLESEVNNGGFDQYLRFTDSEMIAHATIALRTIGANSCAAIVEQAIAQIAPLPTTEDARHATLDALGDEALERLESLDSEFYAYPDDLTELFSSFVIRHPAEFGAVSTE